MRVNNLWIMIMVGGMVGITLTAEVSVASNAGGLPVCQAKLETCKTKLETCETDLAACMAQPTVVFPGDGAGHGAALTYTDNGDGTATDNNTLLVWELKDDAGGVHDVDNTYSWSSTGTAADGTLFTVFLNALNNTCGGAGVTDCTAAGDAACGAGVCGLAGHRDWHIPHIKELQSIVDYGQFNLAIDPAFPGAISPNSIFPAFYFSFTEYFANPMLAWAIVFNTGNVGAAGKNLAHYGRAVRGGQ